MQWHPNKDDLGYNKKLEVGLNQQNSTIRVYFGPNCQNGWKQKLAAVIIKLV